MSDPDAAAPGPMGADPDKDSMLVSLDAIEQMVTRVKAAIDALASDTQEDALPSA